MFGGRDNEIQRSHIPRTYNIVNKEGLLEFETYDESPVKAAFNESCKPTKVCTQLTNTTAGGETEACT